VSDRANLAFGVRQATLVDRKGVRKVIRSERFTHPPEIVIDVLPFARYWKEVDTGELIRFLDVPEKNIPEIERKNLYNLRFAIKELRAALAIDSFALKAGITLYRKRNPELFIVYLRGLDLVCHKFWKYHEPEKFPKVGKTEVKIAGKVIERYYDFADEMVGMLLEEIPEETYVMILSDHGFMANKTEKVGSSGTHFGVLHASVFARGSNIEPGTEIGIALLPRPFPTTGCSILDVTPTVLTWLGLPLADNFQGRPYPKLVKGLPEPPRIPGYPHVPAKPPVLTQSMSKANKEILNHLKTLGYIQ